MKNVIFSNRFMILDKNVAKCKHCILNLKDKTFLLLSISEIVP